MPLRHIHALVQNELNATDSLIKEKIGESNIQLINDIGLHITKNSGKRLRPLLALLGAGLLNHRNNPENIKLAAIIELFHIVTLLHDDVIDGSSLRRGEDTANMLWGNKKSILAGDFLYSRALQMMTELNNLDVCRLLINATHMMSQGEVLQLQNCGNPDIKEIDYVKIITYKTGALFSAAAETSGLLCKGAQEEVDALKIYGLHLGIAFQLIDDSLDYCADTAKTGKNLGDDLAEGKPTLPLIYAMEQSDEKNKKILHDAIILGQEENKEEEQRAQPAFETILPIIESTKALDYVYEVAKKESMKATSALEIFPDSVYRDALFKLANFVVNRTF